MTGLSVVGIEWDERGEIEQTVNANGAQGIVSDGPIRWMSAL